MNVQKFTRNAMMMMAVLTLIVQVSFAQGQPTLETVTKAFNEAITNANEDPEGTIGALEQVIADAGTLGEEGQEIKTLAESKLPPLYYKVAIASSKQKNYAAAIAGMKKAAQIADLYKNDGIKTKTEKMMPKLYYFQGATAFKQKKPSEALAAFEEALKLDESFIKAHYGKAKVLFVTGKQEEAIGLTDKILQMGDEKVAASASKYAANKLYSAASKANKAKQHQKALGLLDKALGYNKGATDKFHYQQGKAYQGLKQNTKACAAYKQAGGKYEKAAQHQIKHVLKCR